MPSLWGHTHSDANIKCYYSSKHAEVDELQGKMHFDKVNALWWSLGDQQAAFIRLHSDRECYAGKF